MSNTNKNLQTQTSNAIHNAIMEAGDKDRPPMLAPGIDNDIYSIIDACPNACERWKAIKRSQQAATRNIGKVFVNSPPPTYDQEPNMVSEDDEMSKEKEINKLMALISFSFKKIYKPINNNIRTSSNTSRENQDNTLRINTGTGYDNQRAVKVARARENLADWRDDIDDELEDQELEAHYLYMAHIQEATPDAVDNSGPIFDVEPLQKVQNYDDNYNVFTNDIEHPEQPESVNVIYLKGHGDTNITTDSTDMSNNRGEADQDEDEDLARERDLLASLIDKLKCKFDNNKNRNKLLESSNKTLVDKLKDLKMFQAELDRYHDVNYVSKVETDCAKSKGDLMSYKVESRKSFNGYTQKINDLNQTISEKKKELIAH
ncbi:hypothetical protein Tco_0948128 [Tanacetum coccineum]